MRILNCHIENFGKLHNADFDFTEGCNCICHENGWGKSTLVAFLRVMLYGFEEGSRDELKNERKRFAPWQGGVYGGRLTFETGGRLYIAERTFGATKKKDSFNLYDAATKLPSKDYSDELGQELFGIDSASFRRTVLISQNDCETSATDGITARIGGHRDTDDMGGFDRADAKLSDLLNKLTPDRKTGSINKRGEVIADLRETVRGAANADMELEEQKGLLDEKQKQLKELKERQEQLRIKRSKAEKTNELLGKKEKYSSLCADHSARRGELDRARSAFPSSPPAKEELEQAEKAAVRRQELQLRAAGLKLSREEADALSRYERQFGGSVPETADIEKNISAWNSRSRAQAALNETNTPKKPAVNRYFVAALTAGILMLIAGISGIMHIVAGLSIGAVLIGIAFYQFLPGGKTNDSETREKEAEISNIENEVRSFLEGFGLDYEPETVLNTLYRLKSDAENYRILSNKQREFNAKNPESELRALETEVNEFIKQYCTDIVGGDAATMLGRIRQRLTDFNHCKEEFDRAERAKNAFEEHEDIAAISKADPAEAADPARISSELTEISDALEALHSEIADLTHKLDDLRARRDAIDEAELRLQEESRILAEEETRYRLLSKTRELLTRSKESLNSRYMGPITTAFRKYYGRMTGESGDNFDIDANIALSVDEAGLRRDPRFLSQGRRDLAGICLRMAMIDAMYSEEKPFVIFDDPFTNLDEARTRGGLQLLKSIAEEYQVLYFACHESRI